MAETRNQLRKKPTGKKHRSTSRRLENEFLTSSLVRDVLAAILLYAAAMLIKGGARSRHSDRSSRVLETLDRADGLSIIQAMNVIVLKECISGNGELLAGRRPRPVQAAVTEAGSGRRSKNNDSGPVSSETDGPLL